MKIIVESDGERLDKFLCSKLNISRSKAQKMIKEDLVLKDNKILSSNYLLHLNDEITVLEQESVEKEIESFDFPIEIVYEDDYLLIVNKPSGLVVHPSIGHKNDTLVNALMNEHNLSNIDLSRPGIVHRIDKDTSGLLIVAKDDKAHELLSNMIKNKEVERKYIAIVDGVIKHDTGLIDAPIGRDPKNRQMYCVTDKNSKEAITHFKVLKRYKKNTLVECLLDTGRTHQIRVHFKYIGFPIHGDPLYGRKKINDEFGQYLHSKSIRLIHPITKKELYFEVEPPLEFKKMIDELDIEG